ncbi:MAG: hypothetical protein WAV93_09140 [Bacteroidales bacterium]
MTDEERDNGLERLFRKKLEENEVVAGSDLTGRFMRRLDRREFLRFNLARMNIWYVIAVAASLTVAALLLRAPAQRDAETLPPEQDLPQPGVTATDAGTEDKTAVAYEIPAVTVPGDNNARGAEETGTAPCDTVMRHDAIVTTGKAGPVSVEVNRRGEDHWRATSPLKRTMIVKSETEVWNNPVLSPETAEEDDDFFTVSDSFTDEGMYLRFPNAFVPGTDGPTGGYYNQRTDSYNQVFHPVASGVDSYNLKIYSKAGLLVFESNDLAIGWDGYHKGRLCAPGVYLWKARGTYRNREPILMAGDVTLITY